MKSLNKSFPAMRRERQALSQEACIEILKKEPRGVMALYDVNGYPYTVVLNHYYADEDSIFMALSKAVRWRS